MASIPGSQFFMATAQGQTVNAVGTNNGVLPPPNPGQFNLEVWTGDPADAPTTPAPGYQGLAVVSNDGHQIDLISGAFAITDTNGTGQDTINADGDNETISGGAANVTLNVFGQNDVANGGGRDTITVFGTHDTVNGVGNDLITVFGNRDLVNGGTGNDTIDLFGDHDKVVAGTGNETINAFGDGDRVVPGHGNLSVNLYGDHFDLDKGIGNETVNAFGSHGFAELNTGNATVNVSGDHDLIVGGSGNDTVDLSGNRDLFVTGSGHSALSVDGEDDKVAAGYQTGVSVSQITVGGSDFTLSDGPNTNFDTIVGFDQSAGDRIHLTTESVSDALGHSMQINGGHDTLITLNDGSTILLKGVSHIDHSFFS